MLEKRGLNKIFSLLLILLIIISISSIVIAETIEEPTPSEPPTTTPEELPTPDSTDTKTDTPTPPTSDDPLATPPAPQKTKDELKEEAKKNLQESKGALKTLWETVTNWAGIKISLVTTPIKNKTSSFLGLNLWDNLKKSWVYFLSGFFAFIWILIGYGLMKISVVIKAVKSGIVKGMIKSFFRDPRDLGNLGSLFLSTWLGKLSGGERGRWIKRIIFVLAFSIGLPALMLIPILNSIIRVITFEVLGVNWFLRSFIIAFYVGFGPEMVSRYREYSKRMWIVKQGYKEQAGLEIAKALAKS